MKTRVVFFNGRFIPQRKGWFFWDTITISGSPLSFGEQAAAERYLKEIYSKNWSVVWSSECIK